MEPLIDSGNRKIRERQSTLQINRSINQSWGPGRCSTSTSTLQGSLNSRLCKPNPRPRRHSKLGAWCGLSAGPWRTGNRFEWDIRSSRSPSLCRFIELNTHPLLGYPYRLSLGFNALGGFGGYPLQTSFDRGLLGGFPFLRGWRVDNSLWLALCSSTSRFGGGFLLGVFSFWSWSQNTTARWCAAAAFLDILIRVGAWISS